MEKIKEVVEEEINSNLIIKLVNINKSLVKNENIWISRKIIIKKAWFFFLKMYEVSQNVQLSRINIYKMLLSVIGILFHITALLCSDFSWMNI